MWILCLRSTRKIWLQWTKFCLMSKHVRCKRCEIEWKAEMLQRLVSKLFVRSNLPKFNRLRPMKLSKQNFTKRQVEILPHLLLLRDRENRWIVLLKKQAWCRELVRNNATHVAYSLRGTSRINRSWTHSLVVVFLLIGLLLKVVIQMMFQACRNSL